MGRLRALNGAIACEKATSIHSKLSLSAMLLKSQSSIFLKQRRRRFCLFLLSRRATALHHEARPTSFSYAAHANTSTGDEQPTVAVRYKAAHVLKDFGLQTTGPPQGDHTRGRTWRPSRAS